MVIAPTYKMLQDATIKTMEDLYADKLVREFARGKMTMTLVNGTRILFRSADVSARLRGPNLGWAWLDEAAMMDATVWPIVLGRLRELPSRAWITTTPQGMNWVYDVIQRHRDDPDYALIRSSTRDNPYLPPSFVRGLEVGYTSEFALQEIEGEFIAGGGAIFKREWFTVVDDVPSGLRWARYWDLATSVKQSADYTASAAVAIGADGALYVRDMVRGRWEWPEARQIILDTMLAEPATWHAIEQAMHGLSMFQELSRDARLANVYIRKIAPKGDKVQRASVWAARAEQKGVRLLRGQWNSECIEEICRFPVGRHDDQVDSISGAMELVAALAKGRDYQGVR
jgi:predicted phage terminase large subunit-like protein